MVKFTREQENVGSQKNSKANKSSLHAFTLKKGDLNDIGDTMRDVMVEILQQFEEEQKNTLVTIQMGLHEL